MHDSSHHIQSKRQSAPIKNPLFSYQGTIRLSIALVIWNIVLFMLGVTLFIPSVVLVMLNVTFVMLSLYLVLLSVAKHLSSPIRILMEVSTGDILRTCLRFEQRLSRND